MDTPRQTIPIDLSGVLKAGEREIRLTTSMRVYWDQMVTRRGGDLFDYGVAAQVPAAVAIEASAASAM